MKRVAYLFLFLLLPVSFAKAVEPPLRPDVLEAIRDVKANKTFLIQEWKKKPEYLNDNRLGDAMCLAVERQTEAVIDFWATVETDPILFCYSLIKQDKATIHAWAGRALEKIQAVSFQDGKLERMRKKFIIGVKDIQQQTH
jgi:hypothetical protein